ncbi:hypothetical protein GpartN1_g6710.t1 [Galdieria partita]|uniref:lipid-A-disaccharide synthase n=1 Tax=Galdieria partita TaxID=83374 RepID=A0A9C7UT68_9RHOD|nr:hypothetical protein GpartN1_g6710.t1 [Galdieria partita]
MGGFRRHGIFHSLLLSRKKRIPHCSYHIYVIAGESSGDKLGYHLVHSLQTMDSRLVVSGVGGPLLKERGLDSLFPWEELSVMGWSSVLWRIPRLFYRLKQVERDIRVKQPDAIIAIDSKGFSSRIFQRIARNEKGWSPLRIQYVGPSVWAIKDGWKAAQQFGKWVDHLLLLFPLEAVLWKQANVPCTVVGPSFCENLAWLDKVKYPRNHSTTRLVALLGSRIQEVKRSAPLVMKCIQLLRNQGIHNLQVVIPYVGHTLSWIENWFHHEDSDIEWVNGEDEKSYFEALCTSDLAVAVSGTAVMECHICQLAVIVIYPCDGLTSYMIKRKVTVPYASMANIMLDHSIIPELLFEQCKVENLLPLIKKGLIETEWRTQQLLALQPWIHSFRELVHCQGKPSERAAKTILSLLSKKRHDEA